MRKRISPRAWNTQLNLHSVKNENVCWCGMLCEFEDLVAICFNVSVMGTLPTKVHSIPTHARIYIQIQSAVLIFYKKPRSLRKLRTMATAIHDVLIIGAGPAGLAVAARLREPTPSALFTDAEHNRYQWIKKYSGRMNLRPREQNLQTSKRSSTARRNANRY